MSRRIEIELTSQRNESEWTWRAAGAKQPKGVLDSSVLYEGAKPGDISKADADFEVEGITITAVYAPQGRRQEKKVERIEVKGGTRAFQPVTSQLVEKKERRPKSGPHRERSEGDPRGGSGGGGKDRERGSGNRERPKSGDRERPKTGERKDRPTTRPARPTRPERPATPQYKRLTPKEIHRKEVLDQLSPEQRPIAEQVLRGGIPAVRQAIEAENTKAKSEGRSEVNSEALLAIAEELLPKLKTAEWMDRAEAARDQVSEISVRDLRTVVAGADAVARSEEARLLASELRTALDKRTNEERENWVKEITTCLDESRVVRALRLSARPPDPQTKFPVELLERLKTETEKAMSPETTPERWLTLIEAVAASPVRRNVEPAGLPAEPGEQLLAAAKAASGRIPSLAKQLGVTMPPPPPVRKIPKAPERPASATPTAPAPEQTEAPQQATTTGTRTGEESAESSADSVTAPVAAGESAATTPAVTAPVTNTPVTATATPAVAPTPVAATATPAAETPVAETETDDASSTSEP